MLKAIYDDMQLMKGDIQPLKDEVQATNESVQEMNGDLQFLKHEVRSLQLTLENEKELMHLRVNILENDMRKVKEKVGIA